METINNPFGKPDQIFQDVLFEEYIKKMFQWIHDASVDGVFGKNVQSRWEAAFALNFMLDLRKIVLADKAKDSIQITKQGTVLLRPISEEIETMSLAISEWLLSKACRDEEGVFWEKTMWDNAHITNVLLYFLDSYPDSARRKDIIAKVGESVKWLYSNVESNQDYSRYSFGPVDYTPVLLLFLFTVKSKLASEVLSSAGLSEGQLLTAMHDIANRLDKLKCRTKMKAYSDIKKELIEEDVVTWEDPFITAEVCVALSKYLYYISTEGKADDETKIKFYAELKSAVRGFELSQTADGMWGAHDDTIRSLSAYIKCTEDLQKYELIRTQLDKACDQFSPIKDTCFDIPARNSAFSERKDHLVFKALRWLLDSKQRFADGSYLHTQFLSVFFCETLIAVYNHWDFAKKTDANGKIVGKTIYQIYDEVFWMTPSWSSQESGKIVELEIERDVNIKKMKKLRKHLFINGLVGALIFLIMLAISIAYIVGIIELRFDPENAEILTLIFTIVTFAGSFWVTRMVDKDKE